MWVDIWDIITCATFGDDRLRGVYMGAPLLAPRLRFNVLFIDYVGVINCFYDYDYDFKAVFGQKFSKSRQNRAQKWRFYGNYGV